MNPGITSTNWARTRVTYTHTYHTAPLQVHATVVKPPLFDVTPAYLAAFKRAVKS